MSSIHYYLSSKVPLFAPKRLSSSKTNQIKAEAFRPIHRPLIRKYCTVDNNVQDSTVLAPENTKIAQKGHSYFTPQEIVSELDKHIIGQYEAKKAIAIAMRNRWRRRQVPQPLSNEIIPRNVLMVGPTGVGKTEIARRMAKMAAAPFVKVEATKYTEVGYRGLDVDTIIADLVEVSIHDEKQKRMQNAQTQADINVEKTILEALVGEVDGHSKEDILSLLRRGLLEDQLISCHIEPSVNKKQPVSLADILSDPVAATVVLKASGGGFEAFDPRSVRSPKTLPVSQARPLLREREIEKLLGQEDMVAQAIKIAEEEGIVFIDEIDKICGHKQSWQSEASGEGVQRDLLPIIEGTTVSTKHGNVNTHKILFVASGAFHQHKPSDLLAELQGRLPIRVVLKPLTQADLRHILVEPENSILKQETALLAAENINLEWKDEGIDEIAKFAMELNHSLENIGARRLQTVMQKVTEEISFNAEQYTGKTVVIDREWVLDKLKPLAKQPDLKKFI